jgi:hypothetical protein
MFYYGFCSRCYNYVDACDCIHYSYSLEGTREQIDPSIPKPPEDDPPEVGTIWYFRVPLRALRDILEQSQAEKVGLDLLLAVEELWTLEPLEGGEYLSVPVDRLKPDTDSLMEWGGFVMPWDMNYFNFDSPLKDVATLAQELAKCARKTIGRRWCQLKSLGSSFIGSFDLSSPPIPQDLLDKLLALPAGPVDPAVVAAMILAVVPSEFLSAVNSSYKTAIDFYWVYQHLIDGTDPPPEYDDRVFNANCIWDPADCLNQSHEFGPTSRQASKVPTITPEKGDHIIGTINIKPTPLNPIVIPFEESDDEDRILPPRSPFVDPPDSDIVAKTSITATDAGGGPAVLRYPCMFHILRNPGSNQTQFFNYPCCELTVISPTVVETRFVSQESPGYTLFCFIAANGGGGPLGNRNFRFTKISGPDNQIEISLTGSGAGSVLTATSDVLTITGMQFNNLTGGAASLMYNKYYIKGVLSGPGTNTIWKVEQVGGVGSNGNLIGNFTVETRIIPMNTVLLTPPVLSGFTNEGYLTQFQMIDGVIYNGKEITCDPRFQVPIMLQVRNEVNMVSYAPNSFVTPGTFGYVVGRSGGVGGIGSPYLPFDPVGRATPVTYKLGIERSQGQIVVTGNLTYKL